MKSRPMICILALSVVVSLGTACTSSGQSTSPEPSGSTVPARASTESSGCNVEPLAAGRTVQTVSVDGDERSYVRYIPKGLHANTGAPLIVDITPYSPVTLEEGFSGFTKPDGQGRILADEVGAVVVMPEPVNGAGGLLTWNYVGTKSWTDDIAFFEAMLDDIEATSCIDTDRVLATGFAVGGVMASIMSCKLSSRVSVLATVSGLYYPPDCAAKRPIPVLSFHGTGDRFVPFDGGVGPGAAKLGLSSETVSGMVFMASRPGALASSKSWATHNGCDSDPHTVQVSKALQHLTWSGCTNQSAVELYVIADGEHTWPGSNGMATVEALLGPTNDAIDATEVIWRFFADHTMQ